MCLGFFRYYSASTSAVCNEWHNILMSIARVLQLAFAWCAHHLRASALQSPARASHVLADVRDVCLCRWMYRDWAGPRTNSLNTGPIQGLAISKAFAHAL